MLWTNSLHLKLALGMTRVSHKALSAGHDPGMADAVIAGTALAHNLVVITRNIKDFSPFGINVLSPDEASLRIDSS